MDSGAWRSRPPGSPSSCARPPSRRSRTTAACVAFNFFDGPATPRSAPATRRSWWRWTSTRRPTPSATRSCCTGASCPPAGRRSRRPATGVVFQLEVQRNDGIEFFYTRYGGQGRAVVDEPAHRRGAPLDRANGMDGAAATCRPAPNNHDTRRAAQLRADGRAGGVGRLRVDGVHEPPLYGNVATIDPWFERPARARPDRDADDQEAVGRGDRSRHRDRPSST